MGVNEVKLKLAVAGVAEVQGQLRGVEQGLERLSGAVAKIGHYGAALMVLPNVMNGTVGAVVRAADAVTTLQTQLRLATGSAQAASSAYSDLFDIAQQGRVSFTELATTFAAVSRAGVEMGVSQTRLLAVTKSISQAMTIGGGSAASMQAALVQLGQGLSSGVLRGEELNSIMEQTPRLAKAIADGLGVPIGKLREMGAAGQLTAQQVMAALEMAGPQLAREMSSATLTVGQAMTMLSNSATKLAGDADAASGASSTLAGMLKGVSSAVDTVGSSIKNNEAAFAALTASLASAAVATGLLATAAAIGKIRIAISALGVAMAANPVILALAGIAAAGGAIISLAKTYGESTEAMRGKLTALGDEIERINNAQINGRGDEQFKAGLAKRKGMLEQQRALLLQEVAVRDSATPANAAANDKETAHLMAKVAGQKELASDQADFAKRGEAFASQAQKNQKLLNTEIDANRLLLEKGSISAQQYAERINAVQASFAKGNAGGGANTEDAALKAQAAFINGLQKERDALILGTAESKLHQAATLGITGAKLTLVEALVRETQAFKDLQKSRLAAEADYQTQQAEEAAALVAASQAREAGRQAISDYAQGIDDQNQATIFELGLMGKTGAERDLAIGRYKVELELKKQLAAIGANKGFDGEQRAAESTLVRDKAKGAFDGAALQAGMDQANRLGADVPTDPFKEWGSTLKASFGSAADGMVQVLAGMSALSASNATYAKEIELINAAKAAGAAPGASEAQQKNAATAAKSELALIKQTKAAQLDNYASMAAASKTYFARHTTAYKLLDGVEKAMHLGKMAMLVVEQGAALSGFATEVAAAWAAAGVKTAAAGTAIAADVSLTAAGETAKAASKAPSVIMEFMTWLGPWGAAAAAVAIAAVLGGGSSTASTTFDMAGYDAGLNKGTGTVLGDPTAQDQSLKNSLDILAATARPELAFTSRMVSLLHSINEGISSTTSAIMLGNLDITGSKFVSSEVQGGTWYGNSTVTKKDLIGSGFEFKSQSVDEAINNLLVTKFTDVLTTTQVDTPWYSFWESDHTTQSSRRINDPLAAAELAGLTKSLAYMKELVVGGAQGIGADQAAIDAVGKIRLDLGDIDFKGADIATTLTAAFGKAGSQMIEQIAPGLDKFTLGGEGMLQTLLRVGGGVESAGYELDKLGVKAIKYTDITRKHGDVGAEIVRQSLMAMEVVRTKVADAYMKTEKYDFTGMSDGPMAAWFGGDFVGEITYQVEAAFSESLSGIGDIIKNYTGSDAELATLYTSLTQARTALVTMGFSADIVGTQLLKGAGGMDALTQGLADYASGFLGKQEQLALQQAAMDDKFKAIGRTTPATAAEFVALVDGLKAGGTASAYALGQVIVLSAGMKDLTDAAAEAKDALSAVAQALADASQVATDAMSAVQKAIDAQKKIITDSYNATTKPLQTSLDVITSSVGKLQGLAGNLKTAMDSMKVSGQDTAQRAQAQAAIHDALVQARAGGGLPVNGELTQALQTVAKPSEALYSTYAAYAKDFYRTANEISALSEMTNTQLSGELLSQSLLQDQLAALKTGFDASIAALDLIASGAQAQLDAALGLGVTMGDINKQLGSLHAAITLLAPAKAADAAERGGRINAYVGTLDWAEAGKDVSVAKLYAEATKNGWTQAQLASATGYALPDVAALFSTRGLPAFAAGGAYQGGLAMVGEQGPELINFDQPGQVYTAPQTRTLMGGGRGGGDAELIAELRTANALLTETVRELQGLRGATGDVVKNTGTTAKTLVRVTRDGEGMVNEPQQDIQKVRVVA